MAHAAAASSGSRKTQRIVLRVDGMNCGHCAETVGKALRSVDGVLATDVNHASGTAEITYDGQPRPEAWAAAVRASGYTPLEAADTTTAAERERRHAARELKLLGWSLLWTLPVLVVHYGGFDGGHAHAAHAAHWTTWLVFACATVLQPTSAITYYIGAVKSLRQRMANMDVLVSLSIAAGYTYAVLATFWPAHFGGIPMEFYEAATLLICFIRLGKLIEARARMKAASAMESLLTLTPKTARRLGEDGAAHEVAVGDVKQGDMLAVLPGDVFPVDGEVAEGESAANEALISGESMPVAKRTGSNVIAGSTNEGGRLVVRATRTGAHTALAEIVRMVETAQREKAPIQRLADKVSNVFVPVVALIALGSGAYWALFTDVGTARVLTHVIGVLVIACPCALGLAVPAAIMIGSGAALRRGVLVKSGGALERLAMISRVVLDKTGTLTAGKPELVDMALAAGVTRDDALSLAGLLAAQSTHPLSRAVAAAAKSAPKSWLAGEHSEVKGQGARFNGAQQRLAFGSAELMQAENVDVASLADQAQRFRESGASVSYLSRDGHLLAVFALSDTPRPEAKAVIERLAGMGVRVTMLSGDHDAAARAVAQACGITDYKASVKPDGKIAAIKAFQAAGERVVMVGDGINDAPALAQADVGIAIGDGTGAAREAGEMVLMSGGIANLPCAIELALRTRRAIRGNLFVSLVYNVIGIPLAAGLGTLFWPGMVIPPSFAALAMVMSDASVAANSALLAARLRRI